MTHPSYEFQYDEYGNTTGILLRMKRIGVMRNNYTNKGTAFSEQERHAFQLDGLLPPGVRTLEQQVRMSFVKLGTKNSDVGKYIYIRALFDRNVTLAHAVIKSDIEGLMKIIYTPTVGLACKQYSSMFRTAHGLHFFPGNIHQAEDILRSFSNRDIRVAVVTDNQGILGIGDQGAGGIAICLGKLMLYTQGAGIAPWHCLPVSLDVGTDSEEHLNDEDYLGWRHRRIKGEEYISFVQRFARAFKAVFPHALCQWEDFSKQNAFAIRDAYLHDMISFNDDIQGTGAVSLAAVLSAMKIKEELIEDQVFLIYGAGAGGIGVAEQIETALVERGLSQDDARSRIFAFDSRGLLVSENAKPYQKNFAKDPSNLPWFREQKDGTLLKVIKNARITVLIGTSGRSGHFTKDAIEAMLANTKRPVVLPLSNPTDYCEADPADILRWSEGRALVATGSPFEPVTCEGRNVRIGQCNNVFIFPGVGLGVLASGANEVLPEFFTAAAHAVSESVSADDLGQGILLPSVESLRDVGDKVAIAVGKAAIRGHISGPYAFGDFQHNNDEERLERLIKHMSWNPEYLPLKSAD
ncbi:MAG: malate dehydrogenase [Nitrospira bacterium SG8_35_4]|nr:MAG: malate dehydrogenase [Nitrospira bacterium SG8_35_4]